MGFRRIVATIVSLIIFFILVLNVAVENLGSDLPEIWLVILSVILSTILFCYGVSGSKSRPKDEVTKEDMTRIETSIGELRKQIDEIHEYIADMYIRYDEEQPRPK